MWLMYLRLLQHLANYSFCDGCQNCTAILKCPVFWLTSMIGVAKVVVVKMIVARTSDIAAILTAIFLVQNRCAAQGRLNWGCRSSQCINRGLLLWRTSSDGVHSLEKKALQKESCTFASVIFSTAVSKCFFLEEDQITKGSFIKWVHSLKVFEVEK